MRLIMICGISGSGKTYYAKQLCKVVPDAIVISSDEIRKEVTGSTSDMSKDNVVWNRIIPARILEGLAANKIVIFDATGTHPKSRKKILKLAQEGGAEAHCHFFQPNVKRAKRQNAQRERVIPEEVIDRQAAQWVTPTLEEGFDSIFDIDDAMENAYYDEQY